jgi:hypothetical protein
MNQRFDLQTERPGRVAHCLIEHSRAPPWCLRFWDEEIGHVMCSASDLFECLRQLRLLLEKHNNTMLLCNGARTDTWASNLARDMGGGRKVFITTMGNRATLADLVPTFQAATTERVGTVRDQMNYHIKWIKSIMRQEKGPPKDAVAEAKLHRNGWVYKVDGSFGVDEQVPSEAIMGAWQVDSEGIILGEFIPNPHYRAPGER